MSNKNYTLLHCHSEYSLLDSPTKADSIIKRAANLNMSSIALSDHGTIGGTMQFFKAAKKAGIKPLLGSELYICRDSPTVKDQSNRSLSHLVILSKNLKGWKQLIKLTSAANIKDHYYYKPRLDLKTLSNYLDGNILGFSGHPGSDLADILWGENKRDAYSCKKIGEVGSLLSSTHFEDAVRLAEYYRDIFGKENFFLEIQTLNREVMPAAQVIGDILREVSQRTGIPCVGTADAHYPEPDHMRDQQVILCSAFKTTIESVRLKMEAEEEVGLAGFFDGRSKYYIPSYEEMSEFNTEEELKNTNLLADMCENYDITRQPMLPNFPCPNGKNDSEYLRELCRQGWKKRGIDNKNKEYVDRVNQELEIFTKWDLSGYFLIMQDVVNYMKDNGHLIGCARGSAGGCLTSYLLGITELDPIPYGLLLERFFNDGRCQPGRVALPDIDIDIPTKSRALALSYAKNKYGVDRFSHIVTYSALKGKSALKDVLRVNNACDPSTMNLITELIPDESKISDELQEMKEAGANPSIIMWALENYSKKLHQYCYIGDDGNLQGEYSRQFEQAIRLEGCKRNMSRHASAIILSREPIAELVPMVYDKTSDDPICGYSMNDAADAGTVKFDFLGVNNQDKMMSTIASINSRIR